MSISKLVGDEVWKKDQYLGYQITVQTQPAIQPAPLESSFTSNEEQLSYKHKGNELGLGAIQSNTQMHSWETTGISVWT